MVSFNKIADAALKFEPLPSLMMNKAYNLDNDYFGEPKKANDLTVFGYTLAKGKPVIDYDKIKIYVFTRLMAIPAAFVAVVETALSLAAFSLAFFATIVTVGQIEGSSKLLTVLFIRTCVCGVAIPACLFSVFIPSLKIN